MFIFGRIGNTDLTTDRPTLWERAKGQCRVAWHRLKPAPSAKAATSVNFTGNLSGSVGVKDEPMNRQPYIEALKGKRGWHWRIVGRNGEKITHSEDYTRKATCLRMASRYGEAFGCEVRVIEGGETWVLVEAK